MRILAVTLGALLVLATSSIAVAQSSEPSVTWQRYDVDLAIQTDGSVAVAETQQIAVQGTIQHGFRVVPLDRTTAIGDVLVLEMVNDREVPYTRGSNRPNTFATTSAADGLQIDWWFTPVTNGVRTFVVRYTAHGAVRLYADGDQLQWQAIYTDRAGAVQAAQVSVHLPAAAAAETLDSAAYLLSSQPFGGPRELGSGTQADPRTLRFTLDPLAADTGAEVRVQFPHGSIAAEPPPWQAEADRADWVRQSLGPIGTFLALLISLAILVSGAVGLFLVWFKRGREPVVGPTPRTLDEAPSDLPAPLAGTLVDGSADLQDAVAALVDLAQRGVLTLADEPGPDVRITLVGAIDDPALRPYERVLLVALFGAAPTQRELLLSSARARWVAAVPVLAEQLHAAVTSAGYFVQNPAHVRRGYAIAGGLLAAVGVVGSVVPGLLFTWAVPIAWLPGVALAVVGAGLAALAVAMPRRTPLGAVEAARWKAFRAHLLDESRTGAVGQHHLAYAVAFGIDRAFLRRLEAAGEPPPAWYGQGPVVIVPGGWYGGSGRRRHRDHRDDRHGRSAPTAPPMPSPQGWSDALAGLLNAASQGMAHGGGSGRWSGGGWGGGGGGGGGRGGFN